MDTLTLNILSICLLIFFSISGRFLLVACGQLWVRTFAHTATLVILPIITFVITKVISGNIALSLGMVGALSIVRFRNPVKSPFELSVYFAAITMGITASVSMKWLIFLIGSLFLAALSLLIINYVYKFSLGRPLFQASFSEGNSLSTVELVFQSPIPELELDDNLISTSKIDDKFYYVLASSKLDDLQQVCKLYSANPNIAEYKLNK
jgi:hypothetical protein